MPGIADGELLPKFSALTGMHPDGPIPVYLHKDAHLFFTNLAVFLGAVVPAAAAAPVVAPLPLVPAVATAPVAALVAAAAILPSVSPPLDFMKVSQKHETTQHP